MSKKHPAYYRTYIKTANLNGKSATQSGAVIGKLYSLTLTVKVCLQSSDTEFTGEVTTSHGLHPHGDQPQHKHPHPQTQ